MDGQLDPRELRVSDAEREHVGTLLQRAVGQGLLTVTERMEAAMAARTAASSTRPGGPAGCAATWCVHRGARGGAVAQHRIQPDRNGRWVVPAAMRLRTRFGSTTLDFTSAVVNHPAVDIELDDVAARPT